MAAILKRKPKSRQGAVSRAAAVLPVIEISPAQVSVTAQVDAAPIAEQMRVLVKEIAQLGRLLLETTERQERLLSQLAEQKPPVVNVTKRFPNGYDVALVRAEEDNEILGFSLRPKREN